MSRRMTIAERLAARLGNDRSIRSIDGVRFRDFMTNNGGRVRKTTGRHDALWVFSDGSAIGAGAEENMWVLVAQDEDGNYCDANEDWVFVVS